MTGPGGHSCSQRGRDTCCWLYWEQGSASVHSGNTRAAQRWGRCVPPSSSQGPRLGLERQHVAGSMGRPAGEDVARGPPQLAPWLSQEWPVAESPALRSRHPFPCVQGFKSSFRTGDAGFFLPRRQFWMFRGPPQEAWPGPPQDSISPALRVSCLGQGRQLLGPEAWQVKLPRSTGEEKPESSESSSLLGEKGSSPAPGRGCHSPGCRVSQDGQRGGVLPPGLPDRLAQRPEPTDSDGAGLTPAQQARHPAPAPARLAALRPLSSCTPGPPSGSASGARTASGEHELSGAKARRAARTLKEHQGRQGVAAINPSMDREADPRTRVREKSLFHTIT